MTADAIQSMIEAGIDGAIAVVEDPYNDQTHFEARVCAPGFVGLSRVRQHQLVYGTLGDKMGRDIHALALKTYSPDDWPG